jgi:hypothetical protein
MRRFTILGLMGLVLGLAVAIAALRNADDDWAGGMLLGTALLIGVAALGAVYHSGRRRAGRLGFAVFGGGYFALAFLALSEPNVNRLPTTWLLVYVHEKVVAPTPVYGVYGVVTGNGVVTGIGSNVAIVNPIPSPNRWQSILPGAANYEAFSVVGHCLFSLLAGLLGAVIARRYQARQDQPGG